MSYEAKQELRDILKALGFKENKNILQHKIKLNESEFILISFKNKDNERITLDIIDFFFDDLEIKYIKFLENGERKFKTFKITLLEFVNLKFDKKEFLQDRINDLLEAVKG